MSDVRCKISLILLLLFVTMTTAADDGIRLGGCRRGIQLTTTRAHRSQSTPRQVGGDFYQGKRHQLVVLAAFRDQAFEGDEATALAKWDRIFNAENYCEDSFAGSVHDYFYAQSYGQFNLVFDLIHVNLPDSLSKYRSTVEHDENSQYMVDDIVDTLQTLDIDWSLYDWNNNGYVNQLLIIYAGKGMNVDGGSNTIWPHQWWLSSHIDMTTGDEYRSYRTVNSADKTFIIDCYCCVQEVVNSSNVKSSFGTICHEYSHCFGFPDFYYGSTKYVGAWDLMDSGNYNKKGFCPAGYSAHERWLMGWLTPIELAEPATITDMPSLSEEGQAYLIRNDDYPDEYYIVENRQPSKYDAELPGAGVVIFHIDYDESLWLSVYDFTNTFDVQHYTIFPANNKSSVSYSSWAYPYQDNNRLTDTSQPAAQLWHARSDSIFLMSKPLTNIAIDSIGLASFDFMKSPDAIQPLRYAAVSQQQWFDLQGRQLPDRPQRKGLYIVNGRKVEVR